MMTALSSASANRFGCRCHYNFVSTSVQPTAHSEILVAFLRELVSHKKLTKWMFGRAEVRASRISLESNNMTLRRICIGLAVLFWSVGCLSLESNGQTAKRKIVLVAGETAKIDAMGHHDYLAGCKCLEILLDQTPGVETVFVTDGWPASEQAFDGASGVVFYTDGGGKQAFLSTKERIAIVQSLVDQGVGLVMVHQAVDFPDEFAEQAKSWLGGIYVNGKSGRGHWPSKHVDFPTHPIARGVTPWEVKDGWLNGIQ